MKKASNYILLAGIIYSFVVVVTLCVLAGIFLSFNNPDGKQAIIQGIQDGTFHTSFTGSTEEQAEQVIILFVALAIIFFVMAFFALINAFIAIMGKSKKTKGLYILNIVFGAISGVYVNAIGAIFGLVALAREPKEINTVNME
jgi:hypothetical protein